MWLGCKEVYTLIFSHLYIPTALVLALFLQQQYPYFVGHILNIFSFLYIRIGSQKANPTTYDSLVSA